MNSGPILLVEDDENDVFFFQTAAKKAGIEKPIIIMGDGAEAIQYLDDKNGNRLPCMVFLDLKLPKKSGLDVLQWVRAQPSLNSLVMVVLTSSEVNRDIRACYDAGANSYMVKPGKLEELVMQLKLAEQYWLSVNRVPTLAVCS